MIEWLKIWTNQVIVAVIIAVIFELIIPNGKNKKYIKMVINLYVLFIILNPIISKIMSNNEFDLSKYHYEDYFGNSIETSSSLNSDEMIKSTVEKNVKEDIKNKLSLQGYNVTNISIDMNNKEYGQINWIKLNINKKENVGADDSVCLDNSSIQINAVEEINVSNEKEEKDTTLRKSEIEEVKKVISEEYNISKDCIEVN